MAIIRLCCLLLLVFPLHAKEKYYLSICAIFRNEARFLKEWIEYHRIIGVEHFYLFNHLSEDDYYSVLEPYIQKGVIELFDWPYEIDSHSHWITKIQCGAYNRILKKRKKESHWIAFIDTDEFIFLQNSSNLKKFLKDYNNFAALGINWQLYGTSNIYHIDWLLLGQLIKKAPKYLEHNSLVKCIVRPEKIVRFENPHFPVLVPPYRAVTENKEKLKGAHSPYISVEKIRINHYTYRDEEFYYGEKNARVLRKHPDGNPLDPPNSFFNKVEDRRADKYLKELEKRVYGHH